MAWALGALGTALAAGPGAASAQAPGPAAGECVIQPAPNGVIRGDRVPTGCVIVVREARPEREERVADGIFVGHAVVFLPVIVAPPLFLPSDPPFVGVPPGPGAVTGAEGLPRVRASPFGPIDRPFGPVVRPMGPVGQPFGPVTQPFRPTNRSFGQVPGAPGAAGSAAPAPNGP